MDDNTYNSQCAVMKKQKNLLSYKFVGDVPEGSHDIQVPLYNTV